MRLITILFLLIVPYNLILGQSNKACYSKIYQVTDTLPKLLSAKEDILEIMKQEIVVPDSLKNSKGFIFIKYVINCNGDIVNLRVVKTADSDGNLMNNEFEFLAPNVINILKKELRWTPARNGGKTVDFLQIFSISFDRGSISIMLKAT
jgi:hypothetical protein